jgi:hypothetical protein
MAWRRCNPWQSGDDAPAMNVAGINASSEVNSNVSVNASTANTNEAALVP